VRTRLTFAIALALALAGAIATAPPVGAHTELIEASPGPGAVLEAAPSKVVLVFDHAVQTANDAVVVMAADGSRVSDGDPIVEPSNALTTALRPLTAGAYAVSYRVIADDSHVVEGGYQFSVAPSAPTTTQPDVAPVSSVPTDDAAAIGAAPASRQRDDGSTFGVLLIVVAAVIGIMGGLLAWWMNRRDVR
jgi:methionine-rich copper-binding protein CopC